MSTQVPNSGATEPVLSAGTITAAVTAVLTLLIAYAIPISDGQQSAILGVIAVIAPIVVGIWGRAKAYAPATVARLLNQRRAEGGN